MTAFLGWMAERPAALWGVTVALSLVSLLGLVDPETGELRLKIDASTSGLVASGDEAQLFYEETLRRFGSDEALVLALHFDEVFSPESLRRIVAITRELEALPEEPEVTSLANAVHIRAADGDIEIGPFFDTLPRDAKSLARLREAVAGNPLYADTLVAPDEQTTVIRIAFPKLTQTEFRERRISERVREIAERGAGDASVYLSGSPYVKAALANEILENIGGVLPLIFAAVALVLLLAFRTLVGLLVPLASISLALLWTLGTIAWTGRPLNLVTSIVPPLVITLGFAYAMHIVSEYYDLCDREAKESTRSELIRKVLEEVALAILVTGATTVVGFLALALSPLPAIREFGLFSALGVAFSVLATLNFGPAALYLVVPRKKIAGRPESGVFDRLTDRLSSFDLAHRRWVMAAGWCVLLLAVVGASRIRVGAEHIENFSEQSLVRTDYKAINDAMGGANPLTIVVETKLPEGLTEMSHMEAVASLQDWLEARPEISTTRSYVDYLMLLHRAFFDDDPAEFRLPDSQRAAKQLLLFGSEKEVERMLDPRFQAAAISLHTGANDSASVAALLGKIESRLAELPAGLSAKATGDIVVLNGTLDDIARSQLRSIALAIFTIYAVLALLFTSFRVGLIALFPNVLPIAIFFGTLGFAGIPLDTSTSLIACIALGIAVDDTIHYLVRFNTDAKRTADEHKATSSALRGILRPVTFTTLGLCLGFLALTTSDLANQVNFGLLSAFTIASAWVIDVTLTPALCSRLRVVSLWDVLTLDLGAEPHRTIPLLEGLSLRQARVVALMFRIVEHPAGTRLVREGDHGSEMFVVLDGELRSSVTRDGRELELARMRRGDPMGEIALFTGVRSSDVDSVSAVRLLRMGLADLEALRERNPRIASRVLYNLSLVLAERLTSTTEKVR